jgi:hypothetical protein
MSDRRQALLKQVQELVEEGRTLTASVRQQCLQLRAEKTARSVFKEWGKVRALELADQLAALEPTEQEERVLLESLAAAYARVSKLKDELAAALEDLARRAAVVEQQQHVIARLDEEAEIAFFAFPRHGRSMR